MKHSLLLASMIAALGLPAYAQQQPQASPSEPAGTTSEPATSGTSDMQSQSSGGATSGGNWGSIEPNITVTEPEVVRPQVTVPAAPDVEVTPKRVEPEVQTETSGGVTVTEPEVVRPQVTAPANPDVSVTPKQVVPEVVPQEGSQQPGASGGMTGSTGQGN